MTRDGRNAVKEYTMANLSEQRPLLEPTGAGPVTGPTGRSTGNAEAALRAGLIGEPSNVQLAAVMGSIWVSRSLRHDKHILKPSRLVPYSHLSVSKILNLQGALHVFMAKFVWLIPLLSDSTIIATLLVPISSSFSSLKSLSWIGSAYLIGQSITQPLSGRLTDIFGRRTGLIFCNAAFGLGTLLCGVATNEWVLIAGRGVAGVGGGAMLTISMFVIGDLVPLRKRGYIQGILNIVIGAGSGLGGLLGGWINSLWGWRIAFLFQVPLVAVGAILVVFTVNIPVKASEKSAFRRVDYLGSVVLTSSLVLFLLGVNTGGNDLPWTHPLVLTFLPLSGALLIIFVLVEVKIASEPIIPVRLLIDRTVANSCLSFWFAFMAFYGIVYYMPVYLQLLGNSPTSAGLRFISSSAATAIGAFAAGTMMRATGKYLYFNLANHALLVLGAALMVRLRFDTSPWYPFACLGVFGLGFGGMLVTTLVALVSAVGQEDQAVVTSAAFAFRSTGSAIGLTVASSTFQNLLRLRLHSYIGNIKDAENIISRLRDNFDEVNHLDAAIRRSARESYMEAVRGVFLTVCGFSVLAALASLFIKQHKLHTSLSRR